MGSKVGLGSKVGVGWKVCRVEEGFGLKVGTDLIEAYCGFLLHSVQWQKQYARCQLSLTYCLL